MKWVIAALAIMLLVPISALFLGPSSELGEQVTAKPTDTDGDGIEGDPSDACPQGATGWISGSKTTWIPTDVQISLCKRNKL